MILNLRDSDDGYCSSFFLLSFVRGRRRKRVILYDLFVEQDLMADPFLFCLSVMYNTS